MAKLGLISGTVKIEEYNPEWKTVFTKEKEILEKQLRDYDVEIQHVGSTSIEGCAAKPIIDIAIGVESLGYGEKLIPILCNIGYVYDGDGGIPGRHFFKKKDGELSTHYIHVEQVGGKLWDNHILFRDYLNKHPQLIMEYSNLKKSLEKNFSSNRNNYAIGKNPFIEKVIDAAKEEKNTIRLMTFNILVDRRTDAPYSWNQRCQQIVSLLKYYNPDIFCIQEALQHQKAYIAECFPEYSCFGVGRNDGKLDGEQVPIFHRKDKFTLREEGHFWLSETPHVAGSVGWDAKRPRTVIWKRLQHKASNHALIIANTHYDHVGKIANTNSARLIYNELSLIEPSCATLLCGDFNSSEQSPAYKQILSTEFMDASKAESAVCYGLPFTYHRFLMDQYKTDLFGLQQENDRVFQAIDHVFYQGKIKILRYGILADNQSGVYPSDHFPVLCDFTFTNSLQ